MMIYERGTLSILAVNEAFESIYGYSHEEVLSMMLTDFYPENEKVAITELAGKLRGHARTGEWHHIRKDGSTMVIMAFSHDIAFKEREARVVVFTDITDMKRTEEARQESEALFKEVFNNANDAFFLHEISPLGPGKYILVNDIATRWLGYTREELLGMSLKDIVPSRCVEQITSAATKKLFQEGFALFESIHRRKDGSEYPVEVSSILFAFQGRDVALSVVRDITMRKRSEEALIEREKMLAFIYEAVGDSIFLMDVIENEEYRFASVNPAFLKTTGLPASSVIGKRIRDVIPEPSLSIVLEHYKEAIRTKTTVRWVEISEYPRGNLIGEVTIVPVFDRRGSCTHLVGAVHDITETKRTEAALQLARKKLNVLNAITFQDNQNAVFSLSAYLELGAHGQVDNESVKLYRQKETSILAEISILLKFAKNYQEMGINPPRWQNVNQVFLYAISHMPPLPLSREIVLNDLEIYADPLLESVIFNLVENVLHHGVRATRMMFQYEERDGCLVLFFEDDGIGVPAGDKERIFIRGFGDGHGVGLLLVREILSITGITIREIGEPGKGARFEILVPKGGYRFHG